MTLACWGMLGNELLLPRGGHSLQRVKAFSRKSPQILTSRSLDPEILYRESSKSAHPEVPPRSVRWTPIATQSPGRLQGLSFGVVARSAPEDLPPSYSSLRRNEARNSWGAFPRWNCYCGGKDRIGGQGKLSGGFASFAFSKVPRKVPFTSPACNGKTLPPRFCTVCAWKSYCYARLHPPILRGGIRSRGERERREYECVRYMRVNVVSLVRYMQHGHSHFCVCVCVCVCV
jgi:hypothetical protein